MHLDPRVWSRRTAGRLSALLTALVVLTFAGAAYLFLEHRERTTLLWTSAGLLVGLVVIQVVMLLRAEAPDAAAPAGEGDAPILDEARLSVRCGRCGTIADVVDTGERPLRHECPGCGEAGDVVPRGARAAGQ